MKKIILTIIISLSLFTNLKSQYSSIRFDHLSVTDGLSQSSVYSITQDKYGFLWFATLDGLNKFDGYKITTYYSGFSEGELPDNVINFLYTTPDEQKQLWIGTADHGISMYDYIFDKFITYSHEKDPQGLVNDHVTSITGNSKDLWIGTEKGLSRFEQSTEKWTNYTAANSKLKNDHITVLFIDKKGQLWIGTTNGLYVLDTDLNKIHQVDLSKIAENKAIKSVIADVSGNIWIATEKDIFFYNLDSKKYKKKNGINFLKDKNITSILFDYQNILWIGTKNSGLYRYDPLLNKYEVFCYDATNPSSISVNSILTIYEDSKHLLWIGTSLGGVEKWNRAARDLLIFRHNPYKPNSLSSSRVRSIFEDKNGTIWIGTVDGGLNKWDKDKQRFVWTKHNPSDPTSLPENHIRAIFVDSKNRFWIGTANTGLAIIDPQTMKVLKNFKHSNSDTNSISSNSIWRIVEDQNGTLWFATYGGGLAYLDNDKYQFKAFKHSDGVRGTGTLSNNYCTTVFIDSKYRIWIGTIDGLNLFIQKNNKFKVFRNDIDNPSTISNNRIYSIYEDKDGYIWIGTKGGLNKYLENGKFESFTVKNSDLPNNVIMGILEDSQNNLWLTTNQGLSKFNKITHKVRTYDVKDGLQSNEFLVGSYLKTGSGMFLVGGINGFNAFYPEKIKKNLNKPSVVITDFMVSNKEFKTDTNIAEKKYIELSHKQRDLTFEFVSVDYILPEKNQYAYKLEPYDKDWIYSKYKRTAKYTNLPPGHYVFKVKGSNNDLVWNEKGTSLHIYIKPAWWQTLAFKIILPLFVVMLIIFIAWLRMRILRRQKKLLEEEVKRQTKEIREQKDEIEQQNLVLQQQKEEIEAQREIAITQRDLIAKHQKEIEDSIIYAKNIQTAAMPENKYLQLLFEEFFVFFRPRDIVSGDFYWASQKKGKIIAVAADCTGHGVPGAFMSMLGISFLHKIVNEKAIVDSKIILERLRNNIIKALKQTVDGSRKDGMDMTVCVIDYRNKTIDFAGANNPMYLVRDGELTEYKGDKMPVAIYDFMKPFTGHKIHYRKNDVIYMISDGFPDQFGGPKSKKFKYANLKKLFIKIHTLPMGEQKAYLADTLNKWMSYPDPLANSEKHSQIDDILVFGIRL